MEQKSFTSTYATVLKSCVKDNLKKYQQKTFDVDNMETMFLKGIEKPEGLLEYLLQDVKNDVRNSIAVFESFPKLNPLIASQEAFWAYLSHVEYIEYVQRRWGVVMKEDATQDNIKEHFWGTKGNALGELWWNAFMTYDANRADNFELTKILYRHSDITQNIRTSMSLFPNKNAIHAILEFYRDHPEIFIPASATNKRNRFVTQSLNRWGGLKNLAYLEIEDFKLQLEHNLPTILTIKSDTDHNKVIWNQI